MNFFYLVLSSINEYLHEISNWTKKVKNLNFNFQNDFWNKTAYTILWYIETWLLAYKVTLPYIVTLHRKISFYRQRKDPKAKETTKIGFFSAFVDVFCDCTWSEQMKNYYSFTLSTLEKTCSMRPNSVRWSDFFFNHLAENYIWVFLRYRVLTWVIQKIRKPKICIFTLFSKIEKTG